MPLPLNSMTPAQAEGWQVLLDLYREFPAGWCLIGGQMVWLLALEHGVEPRRSTEDVDVVVDIRSDPQLIMRMCAWLESRSFRLEGINRDNIGHRYVSSTYEGPGEVKFDILAPDNMGKNANLTTSPPARTVSAPGTRPALDDAQPLEVLLGDRTGYVLRPPLLAAILAKAAATSIPVRENPERDWLDLAFLLSLIPDPISAAAELSKGQRRRLRSVSELLNEDHWAWRPLGPRRRLGIAAFQFLTDDPAAPVRDF
jgi:hypothetical protein